MSRFSTRPSAVARALGWTLICRCDSSSSGTATSNGVPLPESPDPDAPQRRHVAATPSCVPCLPSQSSARPAEAGGGGVPTSASSSCGPSASQVPSTASVSAVTPSTMRPRRRWPGASTRASPGSERAAESPFSRSHSSASAVMRTWSAASSTPSAIPSARRGTERLLFEGGVDVLLWPVAASSALGFFRRWSRRPRSPSAAVITAWTARSASRMAGIAWPVDPEGLPVIGLRVAFDDQLRLTTALFELGDEPGAGARWCPRQYRRRPRSPAGHVSPDAAVELHVLTHLGCHAVRADRGARERIFHSRLWPARLDRRDGAARTWRRH